ncbi:Ig-like domain-containing protein [Frigoribacterium sp. Leaf186]|uniref:Ig-like domain-containing protein n=1 Tax=Frigoribacterium sp. Leaf186 TaxID=1736293 RepID=UPI0006FE8E7E|nr:Ig-like domain-containing protein [Frigoribacterium sp. Leaf186]KQS17039.1 hypothetical protein ASG05_05695 [Frigoribacterium sp. Leaf186]
MSALTTHRRGRLGHTLGAGFLASALAVTGAVVAQAPPAHAAATAVPVSIYVTTTAETASVDQATTEQKVRDEFEGMSDYWLSMTNGQVQFEIKQLIYRPGEGVCGDGNPDLRGDAIAATGWPGSGQGQGLIISVAEGCTFRGSATSGGPSMVGGGRAYLEGLWDGVWAHEMGHTMDFGHANLLDCPADVVDGRLASEGGNCVSRGYEDTYDVMGGSYETIYKNFSTPNQIRTGILTAADYVDVDSPTSVDQTVTIQAREATTGVRSLQFTDPSSGITYWAELATPTRYDTGYIAGSRTSSVGGDTYASVRGVRILRMEGTTQTLLISPQGTGNGTRPNSWAPGSTFTTATGATTLDVVSRTADTATLRLRTIVADTAAPDAPTVTSVTGTTVAGTAEAESTVTVLDSTGTAVGSAAADATGNFTITLTPAQAGGAQLRVTAADAAGNTSVPTEITVPIPAPAAPTVDPTTGTTATGTAEPDSTITVTATGATLGTATTDGTGAFTVPLSPAQQPGAVLSVTATNAGGSSEVTFVTVTAPTPTAPTVDPTDGTVVTGSAAPETGVAVTAGGTLVGSGTTDTTGRFSVPLDPAQAPGTVLEVTVSTGDGNTSAATTVTVSPAATVLTSRVERATVQAGQTQTVLGEGFAAGETVTAVMTSDPVQVGTATADQNGAVSITWAVPLDTTPGTHTITLTGATSGSTAAQFTVTAAPVVGEDPGTAPGTGTGAAPGSGSGTGSGTSAADGSTSGSNLAFTGSDLVTSGITAAALLLLAGLTLIAARRRRAGHDHEA